MESPTSSDSRSSNGLQTSKIWGNDHLRKEKSLLVIANHEFGVLELENRLKRGVGPAQTKRTRARENICGTITEHPCLENPESFYPTLMEVPPEKGKGADAIGATERMESWQYLVWDVREVASVEAVGFWLKSS